MDQLLTQIADYVCEPPEFSAETYTTARYNLMDTLGCGILALNFPECTKHLGPFVPGTQVPAGVPVPGTAYRLDPIKAAFDIGCIVRWLDFNDTWLAAEWGHPSDNLGAILAAAYQPHAPQPITVKQVLQAMIMAHEIQGVLALENSFNRVGLDHVVLVKVASTAVATRLLGGTRDDVLAALSQAWLDGQSLRTYRHAPNTGSRKSWAAGDATSRAVRLALMTLKGEPGYETPLTAKGWGFQDVSMKGKDIVLSRPLNSYVMDNVLFKLSFPAEFHGQTAAECAVKLHAEIKGRIEQIKSISLRTHESAVRIIAKDGPLKNPADRDHCLQYIVAVCLLYGELTADHYEEAVAQDPRIDALREKMTVAEHKPWSEDYLDPEKRSIANGIQIEFEDGSKTESVEIEYPVGHRRRREEGWPILETKFKSNLATQFPARKCAHLESMMADQSSLEALSVVEFLEAWVHP